MKHWAFVGLLSIPMFAACGGGGDDSSSSSSGGAGSGGKAGTGGSAGCKHTTCAAAGKTCGSIPDECGGTIDCGTCAAPQTCGANGTANVCGCVPTTCAAEGKNCGTMPDGCGATIDCGSCSGGQTCGGGNPGSANVCGQGACTTQTTCAAEGKDCGTISDGCGATIECGTCSSPSVCGGNGVANVCACQPTTCGAQGKNCGGISDGCGATIDCGTCSGSETCGGGGDPNVCGGGTSTGGTGGSGGTSTGGSGGTSTGGSGGTTGGTGGVVGNDPTPSDRLVYGGTWEGVVGVEGGIPNRTTVCATIAPYTGTADKINNAIGACPDDQVVALGAGTFNLSGNIYLDESHVTLRGAVNASGAPATVINFTSDASIIIGDQTWDVSNTGQFTTLTVASGATRGSSSVTLSAAPSALSVGQLFWISAPPNSKISGESSWSSFFGSRPFTQVVKVTGKSGNTVNFSPPLNADYLSGTVQIHSRPMSYTTALSGAENLSLQRNGGSSGNGSHYLRMTGTDSCWVKNVKTYWTLGGGTHHMWMNMTYRSEVRHCEMSHTVTSSGNSSNAYCILGVHSSSFLIEDNYFHDIPNVMPMMGMNAGAFAYNYITDLPYPASPTWLSQIVFFHGSHSHYNLFEGNWLAASYNDGGTGTHSRNNVWLRNRMLGWDPTPLPGGKTGNTQCFTTESHHDNVVFAGNVLGKAGYHSKYEGGGGIFDFDATSKTSALRFANYNTVQNGVPASEALTSGQAVPTSYLHSSKPSWFGGLPWPWVDPQNFAQADSVKNFPAGYRAVNGSDP